MAPGKVSMKGVRFASRGRACGLVNWSFFFGLDTKVFGERGERGDGFGIFFF